MSRQIEALVLDDDVWSLRLIKGLLQECFPEMKVHTREQPDPEGDFDIYFVDNDFNGHRVLPELARELRRKQPDALIIAFSATLDARMLKELINAGCDGACDKSVYGDLAESMEIVRAFVEQTQAGGRRREGHPVHRAVPAISAETARCSSRSRRRFHSRSRSRTVPIAPDDVL